MDELKCSRCFQKFDRKRNLERHLSRKNPCVSLDNINTEDSAQCKYCGKKYMQKRNLHRHYEKCIIKNNKNNGSDLLDIENSKLKYELGALKNEITELKKEVIGMKIPSSFSNVNPKGINSFNQPDLNIAKFHDLNGSIPGIMSDLARRYTADELPIFLFNKIYFNDEMKQNWSIIVNEGKTYYFDGHKWKLSTTTDILKEAFVIIYELIINNLKKNPTLFLPTGDVDLRENKYQKMLDELNRFKFNVSGDKIMLPNIPFASMLECNKKKLLDYHQAQIKQIL